MEIQSRDVLNWLSIIPDDNIFILAGGIFKVLVRSKGHFEYAKLITEYFAEEKRGWARCVMPIGSATTNNALEAFINHALSLQMSAGSRFSINEMIPILRSFLQSRSVLEQEKLYPICSLNVRAEVFTTCERLRRVKLWFQESQALRKQIQESEVLFFRFENETDILLVSAAHRAKGLSIRAVEKKVFGNIDNLKEARFRAEQIISVHGDTEIENLPSHALYSIGNQAESAFQLLRTAIDERFF